MAGARIIALITDFGSGEIYPGVMKGVIKSANRGADIIDITHDVAPQNIQQATFLLWKTHSYLPDGTIIVAVVDPGVGTDRRIIACEWEGRTFIAPDNGLLTFIPSSAKIIHVDDKIYSLRHVSNTFHGRDIFAPIAAKLSGGAGIDEFGRRTDHIVRLEKFFYTDKWGVIEGKIMHIDRFGNAITNIELAPAKIKSLSVNKVKIKSKAKNYRAAPAKKPFIILGSYGTIEISLRNGSFAADYGCRLLDMVSAKKLK